MNYIAQLNAFFGCLEREISLSSYSVSLYVALLHINNKCNWSKEFTVKNSYIEEFIGLSRQNLDRARNELKQKRLISYNKSSGSAAGTYSIFEFGKESVTLKEPEYDTQIVTQTDTQIGHNVLHNPYKYDTQTDTQANTQSENLQDNINKLINNKQRQEYICSEPENPAHEPAVPPNIFITLMLNDKSEYDVTSDKVKQYSALYPAVDVEQELRNMAGWCIGNPAKRKTKSGIERFITNWLSKEQNRGGSAQNGRNGSNGFSGGADKKTAAGKTGADFSNLKVQEF